MSKGKANSAPSALLNHWPHWDWDPRIPGAEVEDVFAEGAIAIDHAHA
jgi:hypothetical protein